MLGWLFVTCPVWGAVLLYNVSKFLLRRPR